MAAGTKRGKKGAKTSGMTYSPESRDAASCLPPGVCDSSLGTVDHPNIEALLSDIVTRLDRIEERIARSAYPPESPVRSEFSRKRKKIPGRPGTAQTKTGRSTEKMTYELPDEIACASESSLQKDWLRPEEDAAWADL